MRQRKQGLISIKSAAVLVKGSGPGAALPISSAADVQKPTSEGYALVQGGAGTGGGPVLLGEDLNLGESVTRVLDEDSTDDECVTRVLDEGDAVADGQAEGNDVFTKDDEPPPPQRRKTLAPAERKQQLSKEVSSVTSVFPI